VAEVITVSNGLVSILFRRYGVVATLVNNVPPLEPLYDRTFLRRTLSIPDEHMVCVYQGVLIVGRPIAQIVDVVVGLPNVTLVIQGGGPLEPALREHVRKSGIQDRCHMTGWIDPKEIHPYACGADVGLILGDGVTLNHQYARANKLFSYCMAGIPVVSTDLSEMTEIIQRHGIGRTVRNNDPAIFTQVLMELAEDKPLRKRMAERARQLAESQFNWSREQRVLVRLYERVASRCRPGAASH